MDLIIAIVIIVLMFSALVTYSVWWLFFSNESIFKITDMNYNEDVSNVKLQKKLEHLKQKREQIEAELIDNYSEEKLRELNIIDHSIAVTGNRIGGLFKKTQVTNFEILR